jgi:hypothetical protein
LPAAVRGLGFTGGLRIRWSRGTRNSQRSGASRCVWARALRSDHHILHSTQDPSGIFDHIGKPDRTRDVAEPGPIIQPSFHNMRSRQEFRPNSKGPIIQPSSRKPDARKEMTAMTAKRRDTDTARGRAVVAIGRSSSVPRVDAVSRETLSCQEASRGELDGERMGRHGVLLVRQLGRARKCQG